MKLTLILKWSSVVLLLTSTLNAQQTIEERQERAQQVELFYNLAEKAFQDGDIKAAKEALSSGLSLNRMHAPSIALSRRINSSGNQTVLERRKRLFNSVMVPMIDFSDASFKDAIHALAKSVETESKGEVTPNFIIQDRGKVFDKVMINLTLKNVPAGDVLDHLLKAAGAGVNFGTYTTVISPRGNATVQQPKKVESEEE